MWGDPVHVEMVAARRAPVHSPLPPLVSLDLVTPCRTVWALRFQCFGFGLVLNVTIPPQNLCSCLGLGLELRSFVTLFCSAPL